MAEDKVEVEAPRVTDSPGLQIEVSTDDTRARYWQYLGGIDRVYPDVPVTVRHYEMIKYPRIPAEDGHWVECEFDEKAGFVVKEPDNALPAPPVEDAII